MIEWFRWHHGTVNDPKLRVVARKAGQPITVVIAVWAAMLERASEAEKRGTLDGWDPEAVATGLEIDEAAVLAIHKAMQGKTLQGDSMRAWRKRQPRREDHSTERVRAWREAHKTVAVEDETQCNAVKRNETLEESRVEKKKEKPPTGAKRKKVSPKRATQLPESWMPNEKHAELSLAEGVDVRREEAKFRDHAAATGRTLKDWDAGFRTWLRNAKAFQPKTPAIRHDFGDETARDEQRRREAVTRHGQRQAQERDEGEDEAERQTAELWSWWEDLDADTKARVNLAAKERCKPVPPAMHKAITIGVMNEFRSVETNGGPR